jgi:hypothetical protein
MASKSASNSRSAGSKNSAKSSATRYDADVTAPEDALAFEQNYYDDGEEDDAGYMTEASDRVREMTRGREGRIVVAALASGFAIGTVIGCVIANSRQRQQPSWTDRLACEGLGRSMLDRLASVMPESISEKLHRS